MKQKEVVMSVLLVDDDEATAELERRTLVRAGMEVRVVHRVDEAIALLNVQSFSAILLDYNLPGGDPWKIVDAAQAKMPRIPVILVTGLGSERVASEALHRGVDDYVKKTEAFWDHLPSVLHRVQVLAQAEQATARLAAIVESSEDAIISKTLDGVITSWNGSAERIFGYTAAEIIGNSILLLVPPGCVDEELDFMNDLRRGLRLDQRESVRLRKDGRELQVSMTLSPIRDASSRIIGAAVVIRDISRQKRTEEQLRASLAEKELLLKEVHHRVKNNLSVISSLFYLQSTHTRDAKLIKILEESQRRVRSMALVHETLYGSENLAKVDFASYTRVLVNELSAIYAMGQIRIHIDVQTINMTIDWAVPCGLILNELISNALKHAFPENQKGNVVVSMRKEGNEYTLTVADDGVGVSADLDVDTQTSLGLRLIKSLARQLGGAFTLAPSAPGSVACLTFSPEDAGG